MGYPAVIGDILLCLWNVVFGIGRGVLRFFAPVKHKDVTGYRILVTGGGNGLGRLLCVQFARLGCDIIAWDIDSEGLARTKNEVEYLGAKIHIYTCDLSRRENVLAAAARVRRDVGEVDILINNAGTVVGKALIEHRPDEVQRVFNVNVLSQFWTAECFLPAMMARNRGHIVSISSVAAYFGVNRMGSYCSSKSALNNYMESLRFELLHGGYDGVQTTTVCPYFMNTDLFKGCTVKYPSLFPRLDCQQVALRTVQAILTNQIVVCIPRTFYLLSVAKSILPVESMSAIMHHIGADDLMNGFVGRHSLPPTNQAPETNDSATETAEPAPETAEHATETAERTELLDATRGGKDTIVLNGTANGVTNRNGMTLGAETACKLSNGTSAELRRSVERLKSAEA